MYTCVYECACVFACVYMYAHACGGQRWACVYIFRQGLSMNWEPINWLGQPASLRDLHACRLASCLLACATEPRSLCGCWEPDPGLHACTTQALPAEPPPSHTVDGSHTTSL